jgi:hypothetical protein
MNEREDRRRYTRCSFCGKGQDQVRRLVAGAGVFICDQCVELCQEVLTDDNRSTHWTAERSPSIDPPRPESPALTARHLQLAFPFAHGMGVEAISRCVWINSRAVEFHLANAYGKMTASPKLPLTSLSRRDMHDWLRERRLPPDRSDSDAVLSRALSALDGAGSWPASPVSAWPRWIQMLLRSVIVWPNDRKRLEKRLAEEKAVLEEARMAMREPFDQED